MLYFGPKSILKVLCLNLGKRLLVHLIQVQASGCSCPRKLITTHDVLQHLGVCFLHLGVADKIGLIYGVHLLHLGLHLLLMNLSCLVGSPCLHLRLVALSPKLLSLQKLIRHLNGRLPIQIRSMLLASLVGRAGCHDLPVVDTVHLVCILAMACFLLSHDLTRHVLLATLVHHDAWATAALWTAQNLI